MTNEENGYIVTVDFALGIIEQCLQTADKCHIMI